MTWIGACLVAAFIIGAMVDLKAAKALIDGFYDTEGTSRSPLMDASRDGAAPTSMMAA